MRGKENLAAYAAAGPEVTGYWAYQRPNDNGHVMVLCLGGKTTPHRYKIQYTSKGRPYVRPGNCRLYLDDIIDKK